jgi:FeS assembly SUF system protein
MSDDPVSDQQIRRFEVEIVDSVPPVPKQPPLAGDTPAALVGRKRDFLDGFLREKDAGDSSPLAEALEGETVKDAVIAALRDIFDPEIPVNIYDLGLIYGVDIEDGHATITMTLTTPHCPVAESMPAEVELRVMSVPGVATADVNLVWDPPWNPASMSDEARLELGML